MKSNEKKNRQNHNKKVTSLLGEKLRKLHIAISIKMFNLSENATSNPGKIMSPKPITL